MKGATGAVLLLAAALTGCVGSERPARVSEARGGYVVRSGDTLSAIAMRNGLMLSTLARANAIAPPYLIRVGQRLNIPRRGDQPAQRMESRPVVQPLPTSTSTPYPAIVSTPRPSASTGAPRLVWPADGPVAETFGTGAEPRGIALDTLSGAAVRAAAAGTVIFAGTEPQKYGQLVLIDHGGGWVTAYGHLARLVVSNGERVRSGARLGFTGASGNDSRLHFELRRDNQPRDPLPLLPPRF
ncbi:MAG: M23 family metallopeptidase [Novosphingobium sp.]|nr:M23 family metallopeptidase [Novosphingobium sp.]